MWEATGTTVDLSASPCFSYFQTHAHEFIRQIYLPQVRACVSENSTGYSLVRAQSTREEVRGHNVREQRDQPYKTW